MPLHKNVRSAVLASYNSTFVIVPERAAVIGETVRISKLRREHGGKGSNQAIALARLGSKVNIIASVGADTFGQEAIEKWHREGLDCTGVKVSKKETGTAYVFVFNQGANLIYINTGANEDIDRPFLSNSLKDMDADYFLTNFELPVPIAMYGSRLMMKKSKAIINPAPAVPIKARYFKGLYAIAPNETEMKILAGYAPDANVDVFQLARKYSKYVEVVALTLGAHGAFIVSRNREECIPAVRVKETETTGAGDEWCAAFTFFIGQGRDPFSAASLANRAAAFLIQRIRGPSLVDNLPYYDDIKDIANS